MFYEKFSKSIIYSHHVTRCLPRLKTSFTSRPSRPLDDHSPSQASSTLPKPVKLSDPVIIRHRMGLLASDMITPALILVSRKNYPQTP
ncbi:hypothetical protein EDD22DRAFT_943807 [Suillus occidentalis]|nr:hypothetical protein EDD22DRAFT_943807 [Suillus occidentalis]